MTEGEMVAYFKDRLKRLYPEVEELEAEEVKRVIAEKRIEEYDNKVIRQIHYCIERLMKSGFSDDQIEDELFSQAAYLNNAQYGFHKKIYGLETINGRTNPHDMGTTLHEFLQSKERNV